MISGNERNRTQEEEEITRQEKADRLRAAVLYQMIVK